MTLPSATASLPAASTRDVATPDVATLELSTAGGSKPDLDELGRIARQANDLHAWRSYGDALAVWGGADLLPSAIDAYERATILSDGD